MIPLLTLQSRDIELRKALLSLQSFPQEREKLKKEKEQVIQQLEAARHKVREAEVTREGMEADAEAAQEKIIKLKNQQMEVRKNEEYQALNHEIDGLKDLIDGIEEKELILLDEIEEEKKDLAAKEEQTTKRLDELQKMADRIDADEKKFRDQLSGMEDDVQKRRGEVESDLLAKYDILWKQIKRPPVVVPLVDHTCGGCHLRVSNEIDGGAQAFKVVYCDSCGRMLYVE